MRAALYIDCDSIEAKAVPVIYEDIIRTDKLVICKMFNSCLLYTSPSPRDCS